MGDALLKDYQTFNRNSLTFCFVNKNFLFLLFGKEMLTSQFICPFDVY